MRRILSVLMENAPGALSRIVGVFSQRGYNLDSLAVAPTDDPTLSRLTITTVCDDRVIEQITKQVNKLIDVLKVVDLTENSHVERELMLVKVATHDDYSRSEVKRNADIFRARILDVQPNSYVLEVTGTTEKLEAFAEVVSQSAAIIETARTGVCGLSRGDKPMYQP